MITDINNIISTAKKINFEMDDRQTLVKPVDTGF